MVRTQEIKPDFTKSLLYTMKENEYTNKKVSILLEQIEKTYHNFELFSINRFKDKKNECFVEILFEKK